MNNTFPFDAFTYGDIVTNRRNGRHFRLMSVDRNNGKTRAAEVTINPDGTWAWLGRAINLQLTANHVVTIARVQ